MNEQLDKIVKILSGEADVHGENKTNDDSGQLFFCDAKNQSQLNDFIITEKPKLVVLVGFAGYGKSTFIGSLFQKLTENQNYCGYAFVDSDTYVGFERRVFLRRVNKDNTSDTKRNILRENDILNMKLRSKNGVLQHILVSDKAGETYAKYTSSNEEIEKDLVLENADLVLFFVDAQADSLSLAKHNLIVEKYKSILTRLKTLNKIHKPYSYIVVFTKVDLVMDGESKQNLIERRNKLCEMFKERIGEEAEAVYEVNSKDLNNESLNDLFAKILNPKKRIEACKEINWIKMEIEKNR